jgi:hypothetical protein
VSRRLAEKCALLGSMHQYFFGHTLVASLGGRGGNGGTSSLMSLSFNGATGLADQNQIDKGLF